MYITNPVLNNWQCLNRNLISSQVSSHVCRIIYLEKVIIARRAGASLDREVRERSIDRIAESRLDDPRTVAVAWVRVREVWTFDDARVVGDNIVTDCKRRSSNNTDCEMRSSNNLDVARVVSDNIVSYCKVIQVTMLRYFVISISFEINIMNFKQIDKW